ncbi:MAG: biopolymer transporter ExbD [Gammaproteobacteria bacterium]|nr:biopolymer transporter ExbD [Gammaproteobacteria bacterium]MDH3506246.1 biopolymer transporter ExbD [Gammaproteobacteria bacterium]
MRRRQRRGDDEAQINITPMLDIVFIMLIFFIVTTSFVKEFGVDVNRPSSAPIEEQRQSEVIAVRIDQNDQIFIEERLIDVRAVRANIESGLAVQPEATVVVIADRLADAGLLVRVVDQARVAGAMQVSLAAAR